MWQAFVVLPTPPFWLPTAMTFVFRDVFCRGMIPHPSLGSSIHKISIRSSMAVMARRPSWPEDLHGLKTFTASGRYITL